MWRCQGRAGPPHACFFLAVTALSALVEAAIRAKEDRFLKMMRTKGTKRRRRSGGRQPRTAESVLSRALKKRRLGVRFQRNKEVAGRNVLFWAISEFPKWRKYLISLSFLDKSSVRPVQVGGFEANIVVHRSTAVRGRGGPPPPWESSCRTRTGPVEADGTVDAPNAPTAPWKTLRVFHELPQGLSHRITHAKPRKAPKWRWETRIDPSFGVSRTDSSFRLRVLLSVRSTSGDVALSPEGCESCGLHALKCSGTGPEC